MNLQEENEALREKLQKYDALFEEIMAGPYKSGTIKSQSAGVYRVALDDGDDTLIAANPKMNLKNLKEGTRVMINNTMIIKVLPEELEKAPEKVDFNFITWNQIAGLSSQVSRIKEAIEGPTKYAKYYKEYGLTPCKGILLYGPPGCGKTMIAKAIASNFLKGAEVTPDSFIYMKGGEMLSPYVGMAENNIKSAFQRARNNYKKNKCKSVIFIDEAEAILPARGSRRSSDVETTIVPTFLSEMDGFEDNSTFIILATNYPRQLDEAVIRPGRIDLKIEISRPTLQDSQEIFDLYLRRIRNIKDVATLAETASKHLFTTEKKAQVSGAMIKDIVDKACLCAIKRAINGGINNLTYEDLIQIIDNE